MLVLQLLYQVKLALQLSDHANRNFPIAWYRLVPYRYVAVQGNYADSDSAESDMRVLELEHELLAETLGVSSASLPAISTEDVLDIADSDDDDST